MPELPEVETMRRGIAGLVGARIDAVRFPRETRRPLAISPAPATIAARLAGCRIASVDRFGKRVAIEVAPHGGVGREGKDGADEEGCGPQGTEASRWLVIEPRMTGLLLVAPPPTRQHLRMEIEFSAGPATEARSPRLLFWDQRGLGTIRLLDRQGLERACGPTVLGPDGLVIGGDQLAARLGGSSRGVKVALLDQRGVAGIGNIYAAEILHRAAIDPRTPCRRLAAAHWDDVASATREILAAAVAHEGSSIGDELYRTADNRKGGYQAHHRVYGRAGLPCSTCGAAIERIVQAQRSTFFCPRCQPRARFRRETSPSRRS